MLYLFSTSISWGCNWNVLLSPVPSVCAAPSRGCTIPNSHSLTAQMFILFFAACITWLLFNFLFPNHRVNSAHYSAFSYVLILHLWHLVRPKWKVLTNTKTHHILFYPFQECWWITSHCHLLPLPPKILYLFCLIEMGLRPAISPSTLLSYTSPCYTLCCKTVLHTAYWSFWRDEQNWKLNITLAKSINCCQQTILCLADGQRGV